MAEVKPKPARRRWKAALAGLLVLLALDQVVRVTILTGDFVLGVRVAPFDPPLFSPVQFDAFARLQRELREGVDAGRTIRFDTDLGWTHRENSGDGEERIDALGARVGSRPHEPTRRPTTRRILAFGCSFTHGTEVGAVDCWPDQLERALGDTVDVLNFGVPGYGIDQAFLRWRRLGRTLDCDEVWLGFVPATAVRTVNCYRPALRPWSPTVAFKPRFRVHDDGGIELIPSAPRSLADLVHLVDDSQAFLHAVGSHDWFVARYPAAWAPTGSHWTHWSAATRLLLTLLHNAGREPHALLADDASEVHRVTRAVGLRMAGEVGAAGPHFRILVLPDRDGLRRRATASQASWTGLAAEWTAAGIDISDLSDAMDPEDEPLWAAGGHYSARGNAAVARHLTAILAR